MKSYSRFQRWALIATLATYAVITAGGLVRASGAGLGCPDWPQCFGRFYPPLTTEQVPTDAGFEPSQFDFQLAWTEYINRFAGVILGFLIIGTFYFAWRDHRRNPRIFYPSLGALVLVIFQGWLGGQVVQSELEPIVLTAHLIFALFIVGLLLYATVSGFFPTTAPFQSLPPSRRYLGRLTLLILALSLPQVAFGAFLRGEIDDIESANPQMGRGEWIEQVGWVDPVHRSYSWVLVIGVGFLIYYVYRRVDANRWLKRNATLTGVLLLVQVGAGIVLAYADLPPAFQAIHLVNGSLFLGALTLLYLLASRLPVESVAMAAQQPSTRELSEPAVMG